MATDNYAGRFAQPSDPAIHAAAVTPSDSTSLDPIPRALYVGGAGDVVVDTLGGETAVTFKAVPVGTVLPIRAIKVKAATTATYIVAIS